MIDLTNEKTICKDCTNFMCVKFKNSNKLHYSCLKNENIFSKMNDSVFKDYDNNAIDCKLPILENCTLFNSNITLLPMKGENY